ncbi:MAG: GTP cyclohydrolase I FolE2 [Candidatus Eremiobacteraeota bacterium]|nr:GTP cyclohydrolase I FolE2 [Candidatus Eremiobacteraeota bacterium]
MEGFGVHRVHVGIGSNLGDRQGTILAALQRLRRSGEVLAVSSFYETAPFGGAEGPAFLNVAASLRTPLSRTEFERAARDVESALGRATRRPMAARPIDIDILSFDEAFVHPNLAMRTFNLLPLAEIAPDFLVPGANVRAADLAASLPENGVRKKSRALHFSANRQEEPPDVRISLGRAGVANVRRIIHLNVDGTSRTYNAEFTMVASLPPDKAGMHMSRFAETLEEATLEVLARQDPNSRVETLVNDIAREIISTHRALSADVRLRADFGLERWTPVTGKRGEEIYTLLAIAHADEEKTRHVIGVEAEGMTACPCAQQMVREHSLHELEEAGFSRADAGRALDALPAATHNQRGRGSILIGNATLPQTIAAADLVEIVENAMSSETYDLLKRPDEFFVVNKAHQNPKFVEDVVRGIVAGALAMYEDFADSAFIGASQVNYESIHKHDVFAEAFGTFGEFREELRSGTYLPRKTDLAGWLGTVHSSVLL